MAKRYARLNWQNKPSVATPINATNLNKMDKGIDDIDTALNNLENSIVGQIVNDPTKINNAAVNYSLKQSIDAINNNLAYNVIRLNTLTHYEGYSSIFDGYLMKFNGIVVLQLATNATASGVAFTLPEGYRPVSMIRGAGANENGGTGAFINSCKIMVYTNGDVRIVGNNLSFVSGILVFSTK